MGGVAVLVLTTVPESFDVETLARTLVDERLAACVNILPVMTSVYRWEGQVEDAAERQLLIKTAPDAVAALRTRLLALHPYDVPECLVFHVADGSEAYLSWLRDAVS
jgi:periplasmic divalent cation tolerance protein